MTSLVMCDKCGIKSSDAKEFWRYYSDATFAGKAEHYDFCPQCRKAFLSWIGYKGGKQK